MTDPRKDPRWQRFRSAIAALTALKFFPGDDDGRLAVTMLIARMTDLDPDRTDWLVKRTLELFDEYPGPRTLRAILCKRFKPADGIEAHHYSKEYPDGIPSEKPLPAPVLPKLPAGAEAAKFIPEELGEINSLPAVIARTPLTPEERKREREFAQALEDLTTSPKYRRPEPPPPRQSEIISANAEPLDNPAPRPEGSYQRITRENFEELLRLERERKAENAGPAEETNA